MESTADRLDDLVQGLGSLLSQAELARDCEARASTARVRREEVKAQMLMDAGNTVSGKDLQIRALKSDLRFYRVMYFLTCLAILAACGVYAFTKGGLLG